MYGPRMSRMSGNEQNRTTGIVRKNPYAASFTPNTQGSSLAGAGTGDGTFSGYTPGQPAPVVPAAEAPEEVSTFSAQRPGDIPQAKPVDVSGTAAIGTLSKRIEGLQKQLGAYNDPTQSNQEYLDGIKDTIRQNAPTQHYGEMLNQREAAASQERIGTATAAHADRVGRYGNEHYVPQGPLSGMSREEIETRFPAPAQYGPRTTPLGSGKTAEDYNKTSTFQVDDNGEMVLDDEGNPIETEYGRDVARRKRIGEIRAQRGRDRAADRMERAEINRAASPEAQRRLAERRIGKKRFRRLEQELDTDGAYAALDEGLGTFRERERREAQMADAEAKAQGNRQLSLEEAERIKGEASRDVATIGADSSKYGFDRQYDAAELREDRMDSRREADREDTIEDRDYNWEQFQREEEYKLDTAERRAEAIHDTSPERIAEKRADQEASAEEQAWSPRKVGSAILGNAFGQGPPQGSKELQRRSGEVQAFALGAGLKPGESDSYDFWQAAQKGAKTAGDPKDRAAYARTLQDSMRAFSSLDDEFLNKSTLGVWDRTFGGEKFYGLMDDPSEWMKEGLTINPKDEKALSLWLDRIPKSQKQEVWWPGR